MATSNAQQIRAPDQEVSGYETMGTEALKAGQYKKAIRAFSKAQDLSDGNSLLAVTGLAVAHLRLDRLREALRFGHRAVELAEIPEEQAVAENLLGTILHASYQQERSGFRRDDNALAEAESCFRRALDLSDGQLTAAWLNLSLVLEQQHRLTDAFQSLTEYSSRVPEDRSARVRQCWLRFLISSSTPKTKHDPNEKLTLEPESAEDSAERILKVGGDVKPPEKLESAQPTYTEATRLQGIQGVVILEATIDQQGNVTNVQVLKGLPLGMTENAVRAACRWRFKPATLHGEPVAVYFNLTSRFTLGEKTKRQRN